MKPIGKKEANRILKAAEANIENYSFVWVNAINSGLMKDLKRYKPLKELLESPIGTLSILRYFSGPDLGFNKDTSKLLRKKKCILCGAEIYTSKCMICGGWREWNNTNRSKK